MSSKGNILQGSDSQQSSVVRKLSVMSSSVAGDLNSDAKEFVCGWGAAIINVFITFPINKIIFRQMVHNVGVDHAVRQISGEGVLYLYRGILPPLCQKSISTSLMFGVYEGCRHRLERVGFPHLSSSIVAANVAGTMEAILTPFERIQTLMQHSQFHDKFKNSQHATRVIAVEHGIKEFYRGLVPVLFRNGPSNAFFFIMREVAHDVLPKPHSFIAMTSEEFVIGAVIGAVGSTVFYPFNVIKVHMQSRLGGPFQSLFSAVKEIYLARDGSLRKFYRGVHMNYTRSFISWGIINVSYENLKNFMQHE